MKQSTQLWFSEDKGRYFRIVEEQGEQKLCNIGGTLTMPVNPNLTGRYNYARRLKIMQKEQPLEKNLLEKPRSL
jgi:hypothetical protein